MSENCVKLHTMCRGMKRYHYNDRKIFPRNGVYVFFEIGEKAHSTNGEECDRIVRIGTHKAENGLCRRLMLHFSGSRDIRSSSFRTDVFKAKLKKKCGLDGVKKWESGEFDVGEETTIIRETTNYIRDNMSFVVFEIKGTEARLGMESKLISTVSSCEECNPSSDWLGKSSPIEDIAASGLWQVDGLYKQLTDDDLSFLSKTAVSNET